MSCWKCIRDGMYARSQNKEGEYPEHNLPALSSGNDAEDTKTKAKETEGLPRETQ